MPSARPATAPRRPSRSTQTSPRQAAVRRVQTRRVAARRIASRVRWDRIGRVGLLVVLCVVAGLYVQQALAYLSVKGQADTQRGIVQQLTRANRSLRLQQRSLNEPSTIAADARALGMVHVGEHPYEVTGLPSH